MEDSMIRNAGRRPIFRWIHLVFSIPILGYIYSPFEKLPDYAPGTRFVFLPVMALTGLWMWKGHLLRRLILKRSAQQDAADNPWHLVTAFTRTSGGRHGLIRRMPEDDHVVRARIAHRLRASPGAVKIGARVGAVYEKT